MIPSLKSNFSPLGLYSKLAKKIGDTNLKIVALATTFFATYFLLKLLFRKKTVTDSKSYFSPTKIVNIFSSRTVIPNTQKVFPLFGRRVAVGSGQYFPYKKIKGIFPKLTFLSKERRVIPSLRNRVAVGSKQHSPYIKFKNAQNFTQFNRVPVGSKQCT